MSRRSYTWASNQPAGQGSSLAQQFPSFQISAQDVQRGAVRVEAQAPSGRMVDMGVIENNGVFTANFTPTEVGDWLVSILYDGQHIQGSPFSVRVYDASAVKVFGLEGGSVGKMFGFSVDTAGAGDGQLTVDINHEGRSVPTTVQQDGAPGMYKVNFTPLGSGIYTIRVYFGGMEVSGSPYTLEIVDSSSVTATGEGLGSVEINKRSTFLVNTGHRGSSGDLKVNITSPRGSYVPCSVINNGDGTYLVEYSANEVGEYNIDVYFYGKPIQGSPFRVHVYDWNSIQVMNFKQNGMAGKMVEFDIDAQHAGSGNLEIMVNDGTVPCSVQNRGNRQFHATFVPREPIPHYVQMRFNSKEVQGSPWRVDIHSTANVKVSGGGIDLVPVNVPTTFTVATGGYGGNVAANITSPTRRPVSSRIVNRTPDSYTFEYTPTEVGTYMIDVSVEGEPVPNSPFSSKAYDTSAIMVSSVGNGVIGKNVEFTIDVTQAGEGQLEIMVNKGTVPNTVRMLSKGVFVVSFIPREARTHEVDIKFNGELWPRCPVSVNILDSSRVTVVGDGLQQVAVNRQSFFRVNTQSAGDAELTVRVTSPTGELVPAKIVQQPDGDYKVEYSSRTTGRHTVEILYAGQAIMGSPFYVEIYDPNKIRVEGSRNGMVGQRMEFEIIRNEAGKAELGMSIISPSGRNIPYDLYPTSMGDRVNYVPQEPGPHHINITYGGLEVPGCPVTQNINSAAGTVTVYGSGLQRAEEHKPATFYVDSKGHRGDLFVQVDSPNSIAKCNIEPDESGRYVVTYTPVEVGMYMVTVKWNGRDVEGSPFQVKVAAPSRVMAIGGWESMMDTMGRIPLAVNQIKRIEFETRDAGSGRLTAEIRGPDGVLPAEVEQRGSVFCVTFIPRMEGEHYINLYFNDVKLPRFPMIGYATGGAGMGGMSMGVTGMGMNTLQASNTLQSSNHVTQMSQVTQNMSQMSMSRANHEKVVLTGRGLKEAVVRQEAEFVIDGTEAGSGTPTVRLTGVNQQIVDVKVFSLGDNKYKAAYTATIPGAYLLDIKWSERQVRGSPFKVNVIAASDATKVVCSGDGLRSGIMGRDIQATIDTRRAGPGELTAHCMGPSKVAFCELFDHRDGTFGLHIKPQEAGRHALQIKYGGQHVPGSPYELKVASAPDASKVRVTGPGVEHGILATYQSRFICETNGAGAGQLTVRIRGPKGAFRVEMQRESQKDRTILCRYDPTEVGDYIISVKWSGVDVPGSPFNVQIFDTQQEVERFHQTNPGHRPQQISARTWSDEF